MKYFLLEGRMKRKICKSLLITFAVMVIFVCIPKEKPADRIPTTGALFWYEEEAPGCKFYAEIDGVYRECSREEYEIYGVSYSD